MFSSARSWKPKLRSLKVHDFKWNIISWLDNGRAKNTRIFFSGFPGREGKPKPQQSGKTFTTLVCGTQGITINQIISSPLSKKLYQYTRPENASRISNIHSFLMYCIEIKLCESWPSEFFSIRSGRRTSDIQRSRLLHRLWALKMGREKEAYLLLNNMNE